MSTVAPWMAGTLWSLVAEPLQLMSNRTFDNRLSVYTLSVSPTPIRVRFYFEYSIIRLIDAITSFTSAMSLELDGGGGLMMFV